MSISKLRGARAKTLKVAAPARGNGAAGYGTDLITNPPPDLVASEVGTMQGSRLSRPCGQD